MRGLAALLCIHGAAYFPLQEPYWPALQHAARLCGRCPLFTPSALIGCLPASSPLLPTQESMEGFLSDYGRWLEFVQHMRNRRWHCLLQADQAAHGVGHAAIAEDADELSEGFARVCSYIHSNRGSSHAGARSYTYDEATFTSYTVGSEACGSAASTEHGTHGPRSLGDFSIDCDSAMVHHGFAPMHVGGGPRRINSGIRCSSTLVRSSGAAAAAGVSTASGAPASGLGSSSCMSGAGEQHGNAAGSGAGSSLVDSRPTSGLMGLHGFEDIDTGAVGVSDCVWDAAYRTGRAQRLGLRLLFFACDRGWPATATATLEGLTALCNMSLQEVRMGQGALWVGP